MNPASLILRRDFLAVARSSNTQHPSLDYYTSTETTYNMLYYSQKSMPGDSEVQVLGDISDDNAVITYLVATNVQDAEAVASIMRQRLPDPPNASGAAIDRVVVLLRCASGKGIIDGPFCDEVSASQCNLISMYWSHVR